MNQKDYKEIAGIMKGMLSYDEETGKLITVAYDKVDSEESKIDLIDNISDGLANYFEREDKNSVTKDYYSKGKWNKFPNQFNKKQFLKDCGV